LGRAVEDVAPDIDLTPHKAVELGVSRRHVKLTRQSSTIMVQDLGSVNGTFLNGQKLMPYQPRVLRNEDELCLGRMTLRISFMSAPRST
jgi:pSer/pThr/pTyr-binding forkhead associated (FHA) protein